MATAIERPTAAAVKELKDEAPEKVRETGHPKTPRPERLVSLDAYRGFIMTVLAAHGFGLATLRDDANFAWLANQFRHVPWEGMVFWDLIQPAFMFMVGAAMPFAFASRMKKGAGTRDLFRHVAWRAFMLLVLSQVFISISAGRLSFQLINVLSQIAFTYFLCYWIMQLPFRAQAAAAGLILAGHWALFALFPGPEGAFSREGNAGSMVDQFFGLQYSGHYVTINFLSSTVTTLFGVWTGYLMMGKHSHARRMKILAAAAAGCFVAGYALEPFNPMVKRIWTASFTFASAGWVLAMLLAFYWLVEIRGYRKVMFPLIVVGMNSIFIYGLHMIMHGWFDRAVGVFTGGYEFLGTWAAVAQATTVFLAMWCVCYWLYQRRIFLKI